MIETLIGIVITLLVSGCGAAPTSLELPTATITTVEATPTASPTATPSASPSPVPSASPSPTPSAQPPAVVHTYASNLWTLICPAFKKWNPVTTTIQLNYSEGYYYTFSAAGVTETITLVDSIYFGQTSPVGQETLLFGFPTQCTVKVQSGQFVSVL